MLSSNSARYDQAAPDSVLIATRSPQPRRVTASSSSAAAQLMRAGYCRPGNSKTNSGRSVGAGRFVRQKLSIVSAHEKLTEKPG
ncbi:2-aminobenzoate-CoA ligase domain protein [Burkholderia pseudomallei]|nr:2-aminobenzoate-CoA ligase domain protein [Burkholderia pseudomallei]